MIFKCNNEEIFLMLCVKNIACAFVTGYLNNEKRAPENGAQKFVHGLIFSELAENKSNLNTKTNRTRNSSQLIKSERNGERKNDIYLFNLFRLQEEISSPRDAYIFRPSV